MDASPGLNNFTIKFIGMSQTKFDLEDRLVEYACRMIEVVEALPNTRAGIYIADQLIKSCISPAFNYGEAQGAESRADFVHKLRIAQKELKECRTTLKIIRKKELIQPATKLDSIYDEGEELIAIIGKSISTALKNKTKESSKLRQPSS